MALALGGCAETEHGEVQHALPRLLTVQPVNAVTRILRDNRATEEQLGLDFGAPLVTGAEETEARETLRTRCDPPRLVVTKQVSASKSGNGFVLHLSASYVDAESAPGAPLPQQMGLQALEPETHAAVRWTFPTTWQGVTAFGVSFMRTELLKSGRIHELEVIGLCYHLKPLVGVYVYEKIRLDLRGL